MVNGEDRSEREMIGVHQHRHECRRPIVHVQYLHRRSKSPGQLDCCLTEEDEPGGVVLVWYAVFAINAGPIEKGIASYEEQLDAAVGVTFDKFGHIGRIAYP